MCIQNCYTQPLRDSTRQAGRRAGYLKLDLHPFPVGSLFRPDWAEGYDQGLKDRRQELIKKIKEGK